MSPVVLALSITLGAILFFGLVTAIVMYCVFHKHIDKSIATQDDLFDEVKKNNATDNEGSKEEKSNDKPPEIKSFK